MYLKRFMGRAASFLTKLALYVLGMAAVLAVTLGMFICIEWLGEGDSPDDRDIASVIFAIPVFVGGVAAYAFWLVPKVRQTSFYVGWANAKSPPKVTAAPLTAKDRHRVILRVLGALAVPVTALFMGVIWEIASRETAWSGNGLFVAVVASFMLCGLYFGVYLHAVNSGRLAISQRTPEYNDSFSVAAQPCVYATKKVRRAPVRANQRQPDGSIDYAFANEDCSEWFE